MNADPDDVAAALYEGISLLARRFGQFQVPGDVTLPERSALSRLNRGGPATAADLARAEQITAQAMGTTLVGLEERGLVERRPDPNDGRRIIMSLTGAGEQMLRRKRDARTRRLGTLLGELFTEDEIATLAEAAPLITRLGEGV
jgi:DNA-binding MarR family transcriptional regulator